MYLPDPHDSAVFNTHSMTSGFSDESMRPGSIWMPLLCPLCSNCLFWLTELVYLSLLSLNTISTRSRVYSLITWEFPSEGHEHGTNMTLKLDVVKLCKSDSSFYIEPKWSLAPSQTHLTALPLGYIQS